MRVVAPALLILLGALASRIALLHAPARFAIDLAQPIPVATNWGGYGLLLWAILALTLGAQFVLYAGVLRSKTMPRLRVTIAACVLALAAGAAWLPLFSSDVYAYAAYGEMARLGFDPYIHQSLPANPVFAAARWQWGGPLPICVYGEAFVTLARAVMTIFAHASLTLQLDALRVLSGVALVLCGIFVYAIETGDIERKRRAAFFLACNPIVLWSAIEGHNDTLMVAIVLAGVFAVRRNAAIGTALVAFGALVKLPALAAAAALTIHRVTAKREALATMSGLFVGIGLVINASHALIHGVSVDLAPHGIYLPLASVQSLGIAVAVVAAIAVMLFARTETNALDRWCILALALWIAIPNPYPWYSLWLIPIAAFARDRRVATAALCVSGAALLRYIPDAVALPQGIASAALALLALLSYTPLFTRAIISRSQS